MLSPAVYEKLGERKFGPGRTLRLWHKAKQREPNPTMTTTFQRRPDFLPFSKPTIRQAEIDEVVDSLKSGWITTGPKAQKFEEAFAAYTGFPIALALSSATAGLHIGLMALGLKPGDEVITTPMTWVATVNMIEVLGGKPVFVDIHPDTLQIDERQVEGAVTDRTVGILPVHFGGAPCHMDPLLDVASRHGLWIFEDAAHGVGTLYKGQHVGCMDRLGVFSFHPIKNMTTAEGGVLVLRDEDMARKLRALRFHGLEKQAWNRYAEGGSPQVEVIMPGFKYNFMDLQAAIGLPQLASVNEFNARRIELAGLYQELLRTGARAPGPRAAGLRPPRHLAPLPRPGEGRSGHDPGRVHRPPEDPERGNGDPLQGRPHTALLRAEIPGAPRAAAERHVGVRAHLLPAPLPGHDRG